MRGATAPALLLLAAGSLSGCVAGMAVGAAGLAAQAAQGDPVSNEPLRPQAWTQCSAHAERYGKVHIIDVEQRRTDKIVVWGTVDDGKQKQSFQCNYTTKITGFTLRPIVRK